MIAAVSARGCPCCGQLQLAPTGGSADLLACVNCHETLERRRWSETRVAGALAAATLLMLIPAVTLPLMRTSLLGISHEATLFICVRATIGDGWPEIAVAILLAAFVLPLIRYTLLTVILGALAVERRPRWLGRAFRYANALEPWAMPEVFLVGFAIAFLRLRSAIAVELESGALFLLAVSLLHLFTRATLNREEVWRAIGDDRATADLPADPIACIGCGRLAAAGETGRSCMRCGAVLQRRKPYALVRTLALTIAGALLYLPANLYPIATLPIGAKSIHYTVLEGAIDLAQAKLLGLAMIVLIASFVIPILKLAALAWCVTSVLHRSRTHLRHKARAFHFVEEIGRWSMLDPFVIACFVPVSTFNALVYGRAEMGAPFFTAVVVLTMIAARRFDPRLLWDAAGERR